MFKFNNNMKIKITFLLIFAILGASAQNTFPTSGNAGINISTPPIAKLQIRDNVNSVDPASTSSTIDNLILLQTSFQGPNPSTYNGTGYKWGIQFWGKTDALVLDASKTGAIYAVSEDGGLGFNRAVGLAFHTSGFDTNSAERLRITSTGNVGIGTIDTKGYKLAVAGNVIGESMTVKLQSTWPDYVFKKNYNLPSLQDVQAYIDKNNHLPEIPSQREIAMNGLNLGEMNKLLLKKVEELTLYLIETQKLAEKQQLEINKLNKSVEILLNGKTATNK